MMDPGLPPAGFTTLSPSNSAVPSTNAAYCSLVQDVLADQMLQFHSGGSGSLFLMSKLLSGPVLL